MTDHFATCPEQTDGVQRVHARQQSRCVDGATHVPWQMVTPREQRDPSMRLRGSASPRHIPQFAPSANHGIAVFAVHRLYRVPGARFPSRNRRRRARGRTRWTRTSVARCNSVLRM